MATPWRAGHTGGEGLHLLAELTLAMVLFTDAANADFGVVRLNLGLPERLLIIGLPLTIVLGFLLCAIVFPSLATIELALQAAMLAPTDAALGKPVVLDEKLAGNNTIMLAAGWTVLLSVIAHGVTANPLVKGMAARSAPRRAQTGVVGSGD